MSGAEVLGYVASVLVAVSLTMRSVLRLRLVNLAGALCFTVYGLAIRAYPVAAVNGVIVLINLWHLWEMLAAKEYFRVLEVRPDSEYLAAFLHFHEEDIARFLPGFDARPAAGRLVFFVLRDLVPAGLFIAEPKGDGSARVVLDYVIPGYRDFKVGPFVFSDNASLFEARGVRRLLSAPGNEDHRRYLERMGFRPEGADWALPVGATSSRMDS